MESMAVSMQRKMFQAGSQCRLQIRGVRAYAPQLPFADVYGAHSRVRSRDVFELGAAGHSVPVVHASYRRLRPVA